MATGNPIDSAVPQGLRVLMSKHGATLLESGLRCESLIRDVCGQETKAAYLLIQALKLQIPSDLLSLTGGTSPRPVIQRLKKRLEDSLGLAEKSAEWAVATWAFALQITTGESPAAVDVLPVPIDAVEPAALVEPHRIMNRPRANAESTASKASLEMDRIISAALKNAPRGWQYMAGQWWLW